MSQDETSQKWELTGRLSLLVTPESAFNGRPWETSNEYSISLDGDHSSMVKFSPGDRVECEKIFDTIDGLMTQANTEVQKRHRSLVG